MYLEGLHFLYFSHWHFACSLAEFEHFVIFLPNGLLSMLGQIFNNELFGSVAEEKEVKGIVSKLMEARSSKSMESYELLGQFTGKECITRIILPLKEVGGTTLITVLI